MRCILLPRFVSSMYLSIHSRQSLPLLHRILTRALTQIINAHLVRSHISLSFSFFFQNYYYYGDYRLNSKCLTCRLWHARYKDLRTTLSHDISFNRCLVAASFIIVKFYKRQFTHGLSRMAITALILNFHLTEKESCTISLELAHLYLW